MELYEIVKDDIKKPDSLLVMPCDRSLKGKSDVWVTLHIPISDKTENEVKSIFDASCLLDKAGIKFDTGCGFGDIDWEFNLSGFKGAYLTFYRFPQGYWRGIFSVTLKYLRSYYWKLWFWWYQKIHGKQIPDDSTSDSNSYPRVKEV